MKNIRSAIRRLDPKTLAQYLPESLTEDQIIDLLALSDAVVAKNIIKTAARIAKAKSRNISSIAFDHTQCLLNHLSVRAIICGEHLKNDDDSYDIGIF